MEAATIAKLIDATPYAWELVGMTMTAFAFWIIATIDKQIETYNHDRYGNQRNHQKI